MFITTTTVNPKFFDSLPEEYQNLILEVSDQMHSESLILEQDLNNSAVDKMKASTGVEVIQLTEEERDVFRQQTGYAYDKYISMYGDSAKEILDILVQEVEDISADYYSNN
jgi:TRAP-type C4-dicarboxylate transport system substrate-binding protein